MAKSTLGRDGVVGVGFGGGDDVEVGGFVVDLVVNADFDVDLVGLALFAVVVPSSP